jgi:uncharacterized protein YuzE
MPAQAGIQRQPPSPSFWATAFGGVTAYTGDHAVLRSPGDDKDSRAMRMKLDKAANAPYIRFDEAKIVEREEVSDGIILDFDAAGRVVDFKTLALCCTCLYNIQDFISGVYRPH